MWHIEPTDQYEKDYKHYDKKRPNELAAVLRNLHRYKEMLDAAKNSRCVHAGFLHDEPKGVIAVDQKGFRASIQETRLYTFADDKTKTLHLITIGDKDTQSGDVRISEDFVSDLRQQQSNEQQDIK